MNNSSVTSAERGFNGGGTIWLPLVDRSFSCEQHTHSCFKSVARRKDELQKRQWPRLSPSQARD
jgi:hypothetical protein